MKSRVRLKWIKLEGGALDWQPCVRRSRQPCVLWCNACYYGIKYTRTAERGNKKKYLFPFTSGLKGGVTGKQGIIISCDKTPKDAALEKWKATYCMIVISSSACVPLLYCLRRVSVGVMRHGLCHTHAIPPPYRTMQQSQAMRHATVKSCHAMPVIMPQSAMPCHVSQAKPCHASHHAAVMPPQTSY